MFIAFKFTQFIFWVVLIVIIIINCCSLPVKEADRVNSYYANERVLVLDAFSVWNNIVLLIEISVHVFGCGLNLI